MNDELMTRLCRPLPMILFSVGIFCNYFVFPFVAKMKDKIFEPIILPAEFWYTYGLYVSFYVYNRTKEKIERIKISGAV